ncbi:hypothetical protein PR202_gb15584 [Eleusine coracana subsp. coracana]|uniref:Uncharacterized protein n=1 Tax=Eleusine coracana subsp. coracana TaxID=191504 RepID=A0AAV5EVX4_ELECO|nr:hypothetical protein PR202_gb15584 [Eleusine coracana subsp. coracana]
MATALALRALPQRPPRVQEEFAKNQQTLESGCLNKAEEWESFKNFADQLVTNNAAIAGLDTMLVQGAMLEDLEMKGCRYRYYEITSDSLKNLTLKGPAGGADVRAFHQVAALWRSVACLDVDQEEFAEVERMRMRDGKMAWTINKAEASCWENFEDFTDHLLTNNIAIAALDTFRLRVGNWSRGKGAARWIRYGIKYSAREPGLQRDLTTPGSWRLKKLHLSNLWLDQRFATHVSSGCKILEDLQMEGCKCRFHEITSDTLKNLTMKGCVLRGRFTITALNLKSLVIDGSGSRRYPGQLLVTAPSAAYLLLAVSVYRFEKGVSVEVMPSLVTASVSLRRNMTHYPLYKDQVKLLSSMSTVTSLELSGFKRMVPLLSIAFPEFKNLRTLTLDNCDLSDDFQMLGNFFRASPNLEKLTLRLCKLPKHPKGSLPLDSSKKTTSSTKQKGKASSSMGQNVEDFYCENLKLTEIIYKHKEFPILVDYLSGRSENLPKIL